MLFKDYDPLKKKRLSILDEKGKIVNKELEPDIDKKTLLNMYKTMALGRIADTKALQYQRQGRMLTYAPNKGQEAAQVGAAAAMQEQDWFVPAFRELNAMLYRGVTLEQIYLYWYGNEWGSHFDEGVKVLPINIIIGSQINHASGVAYASKILKKNEVAVASIGDGGTSHGEFYEGLNFASSFDLPLVVMIQNNQYAISTPRKKATKAETLAQKAVAFGIPGMQVDGNDILAMYVAMKESIEYARSGKGPVLIEAYTYRLGPHTTSDDPTLYREDKEVEMWEKRDPMIRFKKYLIDKGYWSEKEDKALEAEQTKFVGETFKKVEQSGTEDLLDIFQYTYKEMTPQLKEQYETHKKFLEEGGK
ncbi:pyruvate dehydrogenase (acetyl-transferring) E1 component subunit alpha [Mariniplasma anaerobium]|uniref:Pyruvate dehydrogenase E1 component subunit alpha n=1 Tax=Mariniplasma anaerobium TaxID=2735436 RepID=A0A7U9XVP2_9MOLU|nr:pyruvate dehydrogenase (acetyl-transferring) E1 component subunit alpha [Mariniplasma anaerobium]BCR36757.1 pyruvate dehydrogenase (acetyl-transferring) E1 component subunit alpha [Mariniplasma anaerobium]